MSQLEIEFDICVVCGKPSHERKDKHIDFRTGYVEGSGQVCLECYYERKSNYQTISVSEETIRNTPNDADLGKKIREQYWKNKQTT